jgi:transcription initiation factor TFIIIB Brf1 subunit/transcription initiation factor TFIIB
MVISIRQQTERIKVCPHCSGRLIIWDELENEPYCYNCGWRNSIRITEEQAKNRFRKESEFWQNLRGLDRTAAESDKPHPTSI